jgi:DNA-binding response OmpR family regulator
MPLDVLIATPSGPFGELIRLTLEADPEFHCVLLDNETEIRAAIKKTGFKAAIFDCSFTQPEPAEFIRLLQNGESIPAVLLVSPENRPDNGSIPNIQADGWITRPFDASILSEKIKSAIKKKETRQTPIEPAEFTHKTDSWWNAFQSGVKETAASNGLIVQNGMVIASTPGTSTALQQQVTASVMRFWNPKDSADLMRYVKDLVTGQEWMMYATHAADNTVLVLLFVPQTPVTKVRSQTLALAKVVSPLMARPKIIPGKPGTGTLDSSEPPRLHEILGETTSEAAPRIINKEFPVEWFKEADLPDFSQTKTPENLDRFSLSENLDDRSFDGVKETKASEFEPDQDADFKAFESSFLKGTGVEKIPADIKPVENFDFFTTPLEDESSVGATSADSYPSDNIPTQIVSEAITEVHPPEGSVNTGEEPEKPAFMGLAEPVSEVKATPSETNDYFTMGSSAGAAGGDLDLGIFEELYLHTQSTGKSDLDDMQPISLDVKTPDSTSVSLADVDNTDMVNQSINETPSTRPEEVTAPIAATLPVDNLPSDSIDEEFVVIEREPLFNLPAETMEDKPVVPDSHAEMLDESSNKIPAAVELPDFDFFTGSKLSDQPGEELNLPQDISFKEHTIQPEEIPAVAEEITAPDHIPPNVSVLEDSIPVVAAGSDQDLYSRMNQLEDAPPVENCETYTVALIPYSEADILVRQIAGTLNQAMSRLCLAFNWKLDNLTIRPTYMQWTVSIPTALSPEDMIGIVRKETTQEINKIEPEQSTQPTREDFWAPESMSAVGKDFVPSIRWQNFILRRKIQEIA